MLSRKVRAVSFLLVISLAAMSLATGCDRLKKTAPETEPAATEAPTEAQTEPVVTEAPTEPETELQTNVAYTSQDRSIRITLPDSTWSVQQDADEMRVFSSGNAAMISIVHKAGAADMKNVSVAESEEALRQSLTGQYPDANAFEIVEFEKLSSATIDTYEYIVKYNATSMWAYSVTYGILAKDEAYVITGTVLDDNKVLLDAVQKSVESFTVLRSSVFSAMPGTVVNQTSESQNGAAGELASMTDYGSNVTLYASEAVNIRMQPSTESDILGSLEQGNQVTVVGESPQWFKVNVGGNIGYVNKAFLVYEQTQSDSQAQSESAPDDSQPVEESTRIDAEMNSLENYETGYTYYTTTGVNLRSQPSTESGVLNELTGGTAVTVVGETANWFLVSVNGASGYISKSYLSSTDTYADSQTDGENEENSGGDGSGENGDESSGGDSGDSGDGGSANTNVGPVSGTITSVGSNSIVIEGDDGNIYSINYSDASVVTNSGLQEGLYISATIDYSSTLPNGDLYATDVTGY